MGKYTESDGGVRVVVLQPKIRAYWSVPRAFHGDKVGLFVEAKYLPDNTPFTIHVHEDGARSPDPIVVLDKGYKLKDGRANVDYTLAWDKGSLGKELVLETTRYEFYFDVVVDAPAVTGRSNLLYVHLHPYVISG